MMATTKRIGRLRQRLTIWSRQLGWMLLIWLLSVAALGIAAGLMRWLMHALGMQ